MLSVSLIGVELEAASLNSPSTPARQLFPVERPPYGDERTLSLSRLIHGASNGVNSFQNSPDA